MILEIVTRHMPTRADMLRRNEQSLAALSSKRWVHTILTDMARRGVAWANAQLQTFEPMGDYVWVLDDDDVCILPTLVDDLEEITSTFRPGVVVVQMDHGAGLGILPRREKFNTELSEGEIGCSGFITRRDVWMEHRHAWSERYAGDFDFFHSIQSAAVDMYWWGVVASKVSKRNMGAA